MGWNRLEVRQRWLEERCGRSDRRVGETEHWFISSFCLHLTTDEKLTVRFFVQTVLAQNRIYRLIFNECGNCETVSQFQSRNRFRRYEARRLSKLNDPVSTLSVDCPDFAFSDAALTKRCKSRAFPAQIPPPIGQI